jgi:FkbM family methyltransferase
MLLNLLKFIYTHPLNSDHKLGGILNFVRWQISSRLSTYPVLYPFTENSTLIMWKGLTGATGNLYCGLMEYHDMGFLLHFLRSTDLFVDIGANVGAYTILASGEIGAETIAVEPVPSTFRNLASNIVINKMQERVKALNIGLSSTDGILRFTELLDTVNHVATAEDVNTIEVPVSTLDTILGTKCAVLLKIDVEGFESEVLKGAKNTLANTDLKAIIIELNGSAERYRYSEDDIHSTLRQHGFSPHTYDPKSRMLKSLPTYGNCNTIYIRDKQFIEERVKTARKVRVGTRYGEL